MGVTVLFIHKKTRWSCLFDCTCLSKTMSRSVMALFFKFFFFAFFLLKKKGCCRQRICRCRTTAMPSSLLSSCLVDFCFSKASIADGGVGVSRPQRRAATGRKRRNRNSARPVPLLLLLLLLLQLAVGVEPTGRFREAAVQRRHLPWNRQRAKLGKINDEHTRIPIFQKREFKNFLTDFFTPSYPIEEIVCAMTIKLGWYI